VSKTQFLRIKKTFASIKKKYKTTGAEGRKEGWKDGRMEGREEERKERKKERKKERRQEEGNAARRIGRK